VLGQVAGQRLARPLGLQLLHEREGGVEQDHEQHRDRHRPVAHSQRQPRGQPQQQRERVCQLTGELTRPLDASAPAQLVDPVLQQPPRSLA
jgi:hypothetical protein